MNSDKIYINALILHIIYGAITGFIGWLHHMHDDYQRSEKVLPDSGNNNERGQKLEGMYNTLHARCLKVISKDRFKPTCYSVMALERKFPDMMPHVHLEVIFPKGTNVDLPKYEITEKYHVQAATHRWDKNILVVTGMMNVHTNCRDCRSQNCGKDNRHSQRGLLLIPFLLFIFNFNYQLYLIIFCKKSHGLKKKN